jgi:hypothetical protein
MDKLTAALTYASWGWCVLPVVKNGKIPATAHGVHDATTDPEKIRAWWTHNPELNIGIAAGEKSGIIVYDIDPRNGGDDSWQLFQEEFGACPNTVQAMTAGGGEHFLFAYDPSVKSCKLRDGIDLLSNGRYFLASPSEIEGKVYQWEASSDPVDGVAPVAIPSDWFAAFEQTKKTTATNVNLIQGNRNDGLTSLAGFMRHGGMTESEILAALCVANETRCEVPLPSSEIHQIARSVAQYETESDVAASVALGSEIAEALLSGNIGNNQYLLTRASSFLGQPSPIEWIIKGWLPAMSTSMIYGESGIGKTFVSLDMACSIATGKDWHGTKIKQGVVVYLAGEGNYGLRQRVASWAKTYGAQGLDNLLISNKAIDLDAPASATEIISAIKTITSDDIRLIVIDTLNNHMSGDENSARDTRAMLNACNIVSSTFQASTMLVHHTAHAAEAKQRARGSSAWRGALDASIFVSKTENEAIEVSCTKMKDAAEPSPIYGHLQTVDLGWIDEDEQPITGAIFAKVDGEHKPIKKESVLEKHRKTFENAWWHSGAEIINNQPFVSRSALKDYLLNAMDWKESTVNNNLKPSGDKGRMIRDLLDSIYLEPKNHGWVIVDENHSACLILAKNDKTS